MIYIKENMEITDIYRIYIGSDNKTNKINKEYMDIIESELNKYKFGYTIINTKGIYQSIKEDSIIIEIIDFNVIEKQLTDISIYEHIKDISESLKESLKQFQILITKQCIKYEVI
jgi:hypothetical protein